MNLTNGHALLILGLCIGFVVGEPLAADLGFNSLSNAPTDVRRLTYGTCLSMVVGAFVVARRVD